MGMTAILMVLPLDVDIQASHKALIDSGPQFHAGVEFFYHGRHKDQFHFYSLGIYEQEIGQFGSLVSRRISGPVWLVEIADRAGFEGCWRYEGGCLQEGFHNWQDADPQGCGLPPGELCDDPIGRTFSNTPLNQVTYRVLSDDVWDEPATEVFRSPS
ncbi:hypothetical protein JW916_03840 [Candidatus Sumerlaeota bacterium]|nr:hypothetical protein [Candidatus Sumerlaeota bacterium]